MATRIVPKWGRSIIVLSLLAVSIPVMADEGCAMSLVGAAVRIER